MSQSQNPTVQLPTVQDLLARIAGLEEKIYETLAKIEDLGEKVSQLTTPRANQQREMTDEDAKRILTGDCKDLKHNEASVKLGLSYGQVYSCRGQYTFRHIHKEMMEKGIKNQWKK